MRMLLNWDSTGTCRFLQKELITSGQAAASANVTAAGNRWKKKVAPRLSQGHSKEKQKLLSLTTAQ